MTYCSGNPIGRGRVLFHHAAGEPLPAGAEPRVELDGVGCGIGRRGSVQINGEPRVLLAEAHLEHAAALDDPSGSMLATIAFAITVRALTKSWGAPPQSLRIASSRWRMLLGLFIGLSPP